MILNLIKSRLYYSITDMEKLLEINSHLFATYSKNIIDDQFDRLCYSWVLLFLFAYIKLSFILKKMIVNCLTDDYTTLIDKDHFWKKLRQTRTLIFAKICYYLYMIRICHHGLGSNNQYYDLSLIIIIRYGNFDGLAGLKTSKIIPVY